MKPIAVHCAHDELWPLTKFRLNPRNPNKHPPEQIRLLAKIIEHQGWRNPVVVSNRSGLVTKGHGRIEAAQLIPTDQAPVDLQDYGSEEDELADMVADNKIAELSSLDPALLTPIMVDLAGANFDLELTGFEAQQVAHLLATTQAEVERLLKRPRLRISFDQFDIFHASVQEGLWLVSKFNYLISYGVMDGKKPRGRRPEESRLFIDSGMLTLARRIGREALTMQKTVLEYAEDLEADCCAMMDIPMRPDIIKSLGMKPAEAFAAHLRNAREFALIETSVKKVFVVQGMDYAQYSECLEAYQTLVGPEDALAIGSVLDFSEDEARLCTLTSMVKEKFPKHDLHMFGISNAKSISKAIQYGATSCDSATASQAVQRGEMLVMKKTETGYQVKGEPFHQIVGIDAVSIQPKLWQALCAYNMGQIEAALAWSMAMFEIAGLMEAGLFVKVATDENTDSEAPGGTLETPE